jgi:replicative superfamily II helicase
MNILEDQNELVESVKYPDYAKFNFKNFNPVQSRLFEIFNKDCNVIIAAATSAGKTVCSEMLMAHEIRENKAKAMYLAPLRALAKEKIDDWTNEAHHFSDLNLSICTGDYRLTESRKKELEDSNIIVMTSEMLNSRCRNYKSESNEWLKKVKVLVVDESHLLTVPGRGDHLETGLMKFTKINPDCRIVFLSATMPNVGQIAEWVENSLNEKETYLIKSSYRPCPLDIHWEQYKEDPNYEKNELSKIKSAMIIIDEFKEDKFLVFVHTKSTGEKLKKELDKLQIKCEYHNADLEKTKRYEVENNFKNGDLRIIIATSTLAWGINSPARRVIITGVHRGISEVETYDIFQMAGRAGRPGYDPRGDVYILLPNKKVDYHIERLSNPQRIISQLLTYIGSEDDPHYKTLAFHLVSEIHHGEIKTLEDVHNWFKRSLAYYQSGSLDDLIADKTLELLIKVGAVKDVDDKYEVTSIGRISSMFYYSPFDVADFRRNFRYLFSNGYENNDYAVSLALGNVDSIRMGFVSKAEKEEMDSYCYNVRKIYGNNYLDSSIKGGYAYYALMNGLDLRSFASTCRGIQLDFDRTLTVLNAIDSMAAKWNKKEFFNNLAMRIRYGVKSELIDLCRVPNIGKVRAEKLYASGFRNYNDMLANPQKVKSVLNMKEDKIKEILNGAKLLSLNLS